MKQIDFVNKGGKQIIPLRIREARISRGLSLSELGELLGVTKQNISKYELGTVNISSENLIKISSELDFPISFFYKPKKNIETSSSSVTFFRSLRSTSKKLRESQQQKIDFIEEVFCELSEYIDFPPLNIPNNLVDEYKLNLSNEEIEDVAAKLRACWNLGDGPIKNLSNILFKKGVIISKSDLQTHNIDAFSRLKNARAYIILGSDKQCAVRSRFDLAHELGHIILHSHIDDNTFKSNINTIEDEANKFASSFLLPANEFTKDIFSISLDSFIYLKEKWRVSIAAMIFRCKDLNIISDSQKTNLFKQMAIRKWRKKEPLDDKLNFENPSLFQEAFDLLIDNNIVTVYDLLDTLSMPENDLQNICFLDENYFNFKKQNLKTKLMLIK